MDDLILEWEAAVLRSVDPDDAVYLASVVREQQTVLRDGADPAAIDRFEESLRFPLPPSYRSFLLRTNGAYAGGLGVVRGADVAIEHSYFPGFLPVERLTPQVPPPGVWETYLLDEGLDKAYGPKTHLRKPVSEWQYLNARPSHDPLICKPGHYRHLMHVSLGDVEGQVLLNPLVRQPDGEWEVWCYSPKNPGSYRFPSFRTWMQRLVDEVEQRSALPGTPDLSDLAEMRAALAASVGDVPPHQPKPMTIDEILSHYHETHDWYWANSVRLWARTAGADAVAVVKRCLAEEPFEDFNNREHFYSALAENGTPESRAAVQDLFAVSPNSTALIEALADFGDARSRTIVLDHCAAADDPPMAIVSRLGRFRSDDTVEVLAAIVARPTDSTWPIVQDAAIVALEDLGSEKARAVLADLDRLDSWRCLARLGDERALGPLTTMLQSDEADLRRSALDGLRDLSHPDSADTMRHVIATGPIDSDDVAIAAHTLAVLRTDDAERLLVDLASRLLDDEDAPSVIGRWLACFEDS